MVSHTQQLTNARKKGTLNFANTRIKSQIIKTGRRTKSHSPTLIDTDRIIDDYLPKEARQQILNMKDVDTALKILENKDGLGNYITADRDGFLKELFNQTLGAKIKKIQNSSVTLRSGRKISGLKINATTYLTATKSQISARSFKTGRFTSIPRKNKIVRSL